ncbi:Hypothetical protein HDN1F_14030 [gamma proteobacterium HdN1]|nr:Hypothetical protein HDN1F_14030 [gamma proteobacterium HdN1]
MAVTPQPAATLVVVRDTEYGPEVLLQQRSKDARFVGGAWVFPGGRVDSDDHLPAWEDRCGISDLEASARLGIKHGGLAYWVAAIRECFEEAGLIALLDTEPRAANTLNEWRHKLTQGQQSFAQLCANESLYLDAHGIQYLSHWITPEPLPMRFDTRFFITRAPVGQTPHHDMFEAINTEWIRPEQALERNREKKMVLILPTLITLQQMVGHPTCEILIEKMTSPTERQARAKRRPPGLQ